VTKKFSITTNENTRVSVYTVFYLAQSVAQQYSTVANTIMNKLNLDQEVLYPKSDADKFFEGMRRNDLAWLGSGKPKTIRDGNNVSIVKSKGPQ